MFARLGQFTHRRRRWVLAAAALLTVLAGLLGPAVADAVSGGGFDDPDAESTRAAEVLQDRFGRTYADVVVLWSHDELTPADAAFEQQVTALLADLPRDATVRVLSPWTPGLPDESRAALLGTDGHTAMALLSLAGEDAGARSDAYAAIEADLEAPAPWHTDLAGSVPVMTELQHAAEEDIVRAEMLAMPILLVLMVLIFGSLTAALLPVTVGVVAILGAMGLLRLLTLVTDVSTFALNVTTILGLGLAIDYALFMVSRFREELARGTAGAPAGSGADVGAAVARTVATAGRTVAFSGLTVLIAFAGLLFFPQMFLRSMGLGGMAVVLLDMVLALTLLPALLAVLGHRVDAGRLPRGLTSRLAGRRTSRTARTAAGGDAGPETPRGTDPARDGGWLRLAHAVLRRPGTVAVAATAVLVLLALPALDLRAGISDVRDLPESSVSRQATGVLAERYPSSDDVALDVVVRGEVDQADLQAYAADLAALPGAVSAAVAGFDDGPDGALPVTHLSVMTDGVVDAPETRDLVAAVRDHAVPDGVHDVLVGGAAATNVDSTAAITRTLPVTLAFVAGVTIVLLFLALGSIVLPVKAVVMNIASLAATIGFIVWGFDQGHLAGLLGFTETGRIDPSNLVLVAVISFGLAMDYELFLLSRIREEHLRGAGAAESIAVGLARSGRTITSAALLLVVVLAAMATSGVTFLKLIGIGLAFAVALDATVVRALLVPATMRLLGRVNWWLPAPLARFHARFGISEGDLEPVARPTSDDAPTPGSGTREQPELVGAGR